MAYVKILYEKWGTDGNVLARFLTGPDRDSAQYSGSVVLPDTLLDNMLDALVYGAAELSFPEGKLEVAFAPGEDVD